MKVLIIRVDSGGNIGNGHYIRCITLAREWQELGGCVTFISSKISPSIEIIIKYYQMHIEYNPHPIGSKEDLLFLMQYLCNNPHEWLILDGYLFDEQYQKKLLEEKEKILLIDDYVNFNHYYANIILNQNITASKKNYRSFSSKTKFLMGPHYYLLRQDFFVSKKEKKKIVDKIKTILITLGSCDSNNNIFRIINILMTLSLEGIEIVVIAGGNNPHYNSLVKLVGHNSFIKLYKNSEQLSELMIWADLIICGVGITTYEAAYFGVPMCIMQSCKEHSSIAKKLHRLKMAVNLDGTNKTDSQIQKNILKFINSKEIRTNYSHNSEKIVDGYGVKRVIKEIIIDNIQLRKVSANDSRILWEWANDSKVRDNAFTTNSITWDNHVTWLSEKISNINCIFYIAYYNEKKAIGQIRFDIINNEAQIDISVDSSMRNVGYGSVIIDKGVKAFKLKYPSTPIVAYIKRNNIQSISCFKKVGFQLYHDIMIGGDESIILRL